jgi:hypothetical protein
VKALSLWQPWAQLIVAGRKKIETRHWETKYRGPLAIHAAKKDGAPIRDFAQGFGYDNKSLPRGVIVCTVQLVDCLPAGLALLRSEQARTEEKLGYGDFAEGRFCWIFDDIQPIEPIAWRGEQGLFTLPEDWNQSR